MAACALSHTVLQFQRRASESAARRGGAWQRERGARQSGRGLQRERAAEGESGQRADRAREGCRWRERTERERRAAEGESGQSGRGGLQRERADRAGEGCRGRERSVGPWGRCPLSLTRPACILFTALSPRPRVQLGSTDVTKTERDKL